MLVKIRAIPDRTTNAKEPASHSQEDRCAPEKITGKDGPADFKVLHPLSADVVANATQ